MNNKYLLVLFVLTLFIFCENQSKLELIDENLVGQYIDKFNNKDVELYQQFISNAEAKTFILDNVPLIDIPDKDIEETYYFRWWTYRKHIKNTKDGFVITEFLPEVNWSKKHNTINCPAAHHIYEGRWLRDTKYVSDYIDFWLKKSEDGIRQYSFWVADATLSFHKINRNDSLINDHLPFLLKNSLALELTSHWKIYIGALSASLLICIPMILNDHHQGRDKLVLLAIGMIFLSQLAFTFFSSSLVPVFLALAVYFGGFNFLEASLPARLSIMSDDNVRGASLGVFSSAQFLGAFTGGLVGGHFLSQDLPSDVFFICALFAAIWLVIQGFIFSKRM